MTQTCPERGGPRRQIATAASSCISGRCPNKDSLSITSIESFCSRAPDIHAKTGLGFGIGTVASSLASR
jgi:hypothetical protein